MRQASLTFDETSDVLALARYDWRLCAPPCAFGVSVSWFGPHHCPICAVAVERSCEAFEAMVRAGKYDAHGYTPAERKAQHRRNRERAAHAPLFTEVSA